MQYERMHHGAVRGEVEQKSERFPSAMRSALVCRYRTRLVMRAGGPVAAPSAKARGEPTGRGSSDARTVTRRVPADATARSFAGETSLSFGFPRFSPHSLLPRKPSPLYLLQLGSATRTRVAGRYRAAPSSRLLIASWKSLSANQRDLRPLLVCRSHASSLPMRRVDGAPLLVVGPPLLHVVIAVLAWAAANVWLSRFWLSRCCTTRRCLSSSRRAASFLILIDSRIM